MTVIDKEGVELPSLSSAHDKAICDAREIASAEVTEGHLNLKHRIEVAGEDGKTLLSVRFEDAIELES